MEQFKTMATALEAYDAPFRLDPFKKIHWKVVSEWHKQANIKYETDAKGNLKWAAVIKATKPTHQWIDFTGTAVSFARIREKECLMFAYAPEYLGELCEYLKQESKHGLWFTRINQENPKNALVLKDMQAQFISAKIAGVGSDIYGLWFVGPRVIKPVSNAQQVCFARFNQRFDFSDISSRLLDSEVSFEVTDRGTRYGGPDKTWRRVVIRKAGDSREGVKQQLKASPVFKVTPELLNVLEELVPLSCLDAMMLTRVSADKGIIVRHTDIALDKVKNKTRFGLAPGMTQRFHVVLQSNPECEFSIWDLHGVRQSVVMGSGEVWYTDIRKPHEINNKGSVTRLHLVVDCFSDANIGRHFEKSTVNCSVDA